MDETLIYVAGMRKTKNTTLVSILILVVSNWEMTHRKVYLAEATNMDPGVRTMSLNKHKVVEGR